MADAPAPEGGYMSVGEVARRAGVTVRSVQYYDQQGILCPSAKGPHNERLYTPDDLERLYCVLCLKYAGMSLGQVRAFVQGDSADAAEVFSEAIERCEYEFSDLLHRHAVLSGMRQALSDAGRGGFRPDWRAMARDIGAAAPIPDEGRRCVVAAWHGVIAEAVGLMRRREPLDTPASRALARKVIALRKADAARPEQERFSLTEQAAVPGDALGGASFGGLRQEMADYLDRLVLACEEVDG